MTKKISISFRLSPEAIELIKKLAENLGVSQVAVLEFSLDT